MVPNTRLSFIQSDDFLNYKLNCPQKHSEPAHQYLGLRQFLHKILHYNVPVRHMKSSRTRLTSSTHHNAQVSCMKIGEWTEAKNCTRITTSNTVQSSEVTRLLFFEIISTLYQKDAYKYASHKHKLFSAVHHQRKVNPLFHSTIYLLTHTKLRVQQIRYFIGYILQSWGSVAVKALRYYSEGPGIDSRWCHWIFQ